MKTDIRLEHGFAVNFFQALNLENAFCSNGGHEMTVCWKRFLEKIMCLRTRRETSVWYRSMTNSVIQLR